MKVGTFKNNDALAKLIQCFRFKNKIKLKKKNPEGKYLFRNDSTFSFGAHLP